MYPREPSQKLVVDENRLDPSSFTWPDGVRMPLVLTFELTGVPSPTERQIVNTTMEFGPRRGLGNVLDVLDRYDAGATFFVDGRTAESRPELARRPSEHGHDVAPLGYRIEPHTGMSEEEERIVVSSALAAVESATGSAPSGWRTPRSAPSWHTLGLLREAGLSWDSSIRNDDLAYVLTSPGHEGLVEIPFGGAADYRHYSGFPNPMMLSPSVKDVWLDELEVAYEESAEQLAMCVFTFNPAFTGRPSELAVLDMVLAEAAKKEGIWFAKCSELADWVGSHPNWLYKASEEDGSV